MRLSKTWLTSTMKDDRLGSLALMHFNYGLDKTKAAYLPYDMAFPQQYVIDKSACSGDCGQKCLEVCAYDAIELHMPPQTLNFNVGAVIMASGWELYDATKMDNLGFGVVANVITNMQMERLAAANEEELDHQLRTAVALAEPIMLFVMAGVVGTIVVGMLLPIFTLQEYIR